jgi:hypothetical protein
MAGRWSKSVTKISVEIHVVESRRQIQRRGLAEKVAKGEVQFTVMQ